ncbi:MAG: DUF1648 domain-containing protein [Gemmatimonadota bacterium]|nr:DUF1648 domain-containing protein [Gemmatimonadota bacterium]
MKTRSAGFYLFWFLFICAFIHMFYYYPLLPDKVASHFNATGEADNWSSREFFIGFYIMITLVMTVTFAGFGYIGPKLPESLINLPNKPYWLAPERKEKTFAFISDSLFQLGAVTLLLLISMMHLTFRANMDKSNNIGVLPWVFIGCFLIFTAVWLVQLYRKFLKIPCRMN